MMLFFLDGSALAKRYIAELGTPLVDSLKATITGKEHPHEND